MGEKVNRGEKNGRAKLTEDEVVNIRAYYHAGRTQQSLATEYGVSKMLISLIVRRKKWAHVP